MCNRRKSVSREKKFGVKGLLAGERPRIISYLAELLSGEEKSRKKLRGSEGMHDATRLRGNLIWNHCFGISRGRTPQMFCKIAWGNKVILYVRLQMSRPFNQNTKNSIETKRKINA